MAKKGLPGKRRERESDNSRTPTAAAPAPHAGRPSALLDTRVIYCGDCREQLEKLPTGVIESPCPLHRPALTFALIDAVLARPEQQVHGGRRSHCCRVSHTAFAAIDL